MAISREMNVVLLMLRARPIADGRGFEDVRHSHAALARVLRALPEVARETTHDGVRGEWLTPPGPTPRRTLLYLHGGGYVGGSVDSHRGLTSRLAAACHARVLALEYSLAPERPFPAAVHDAVAAVRHLLGLGTPPAQLVLAGDSAGGGLTIAALVALRDAGLPLPAAAMCLSPWVDLEGLGESMVTNAPHDPIIQPEPLRRMAALYLAGADPRHPLAAPLYAPLHDLPPLLIVAGTGETLRDDARRLAQRARAQGVMVTLELWDDVIHAWPLFAPMLPEGQRAVQRMAIFLDERLGPVQAGAEASCDAIR